MEVFKRNLLLCLVSILTIKSVVSRHVSSNTREEKEDPNNMQVPISCSSELRIQISDAEYDFLIKEFQRSEGLATRNRKQAARNIGSKGIDNRPTSIPGFISEEVTLSILSEIFQRRGFSDHTISDFLVTRKNEDSEFIPSARRKNGAELDQERPGCRCVDSFFLDLSPPRLPRRHRLPDAGFIPNIYNLGDVCEIALDLLKSDLGVMQRSRSYPLSPLSRELITGTEDMKRIINDEKDIENLGDGIDAKEKIEKILEKLAKVIEIMRIRIKSV